MPEVTSYTPGTFCWPELSTTDQKGAVAFYRALFGWDVKDLGGAVFCVWQPKVHIGATIIREPNTLCWTELLTGDTPAAEHFYTRLFGWTAKKGTAAPHEYTEFAVAGTPDSGKMPLDPAWGPVPPHWLSYFQVVDCDQAADKGNELGGKVLTPPADIPTVGRFALVQDPQGATFGLFTHRP